jgi:spoIIIJ-associated protein
MSQEEGHSADVALAEGATDADRGAETEDGQSARKRGPRRKGDGSKKKKRERIEPPDERSALALEFVTHVLEDMEVDCEAVMCKPDEENSEEIRIEIVGRDSARIIGKKGQVLQALQFLTHRVINRPGEDRRHILVDAEGYRSRRDDNLASMARKLGKEALKLGKIITFEPMNPRDRRVVHMALAKFEGVITKSEGEGDDRRVQIIPVRR